MFIRLPSQSLRAALLCICVGLTAAEAPAAPTAEVAKKCATLTQKAFPPRVVGNPAAGSAAGSSRDERAYFNECISNGGNVKELAPDKGKSPQQAPGSPDSKP
jgi:hypothetical protein